MRPCVVRRETAMMRFAPFLLFMTLAVALTAVADQTDPRLDPLFQELRSTPHPDRADHLQAQIWAIWYENDDPQVREAMAEGLKALGLDNYEKAVNAFTRVIDLDPRFAEGWNRRATTYYLMGRYRNSLGDIERVLELEPRHFGALAGRGLCLEEQGKLNAAVDALREALKVNPHMESVEIEIIRIQHRLRQQI
jgi:tetratricopeptide (TPR) repeat protein